MAHQILLALNCVYTWFKNPFESVGGLHALTVRCLEDSRSFCCEPSSLFWLRQRFLYLLSWLVVAPKRNLLINKRCGRLSPRLLTQEDFNISSTEGRSPCLCVLSPISVCSSNFKVNSKETSSTAAWGSSLISCILLIFSPTLFPSAVPTRFSFPSISFYILLSIIIPTFWLSLSSAGKVEELRRGESPKGWFIISLCLSPYLCYHTFAAFAQALTLISYRHTNEHYYYLCRNTYKTMDIQTGPWDH